MAIPLSALPAEVRREIRQRKGTLFLLFLLVSFSVLVYALMQPVQYQSSVIVEDRSARALDEGEMRALIRERLQQDGTYDSLMARVLVLEQGGDRSESRIGSIIEERLEIRPLEGDRFRLRFESTESQAAQLLLRGISGSLERAESFQEELQDSPQLQFLDQQIAESKGLVERAREALRSYDSENPAQPDLVSLEEETRRLEAQIEDAEQTLLKALSARQKMQNDLAARPEDSNRQQTAELLARLSRADRQIEALADEKRNLQVAVANRRASLESADTRVSERRELQRNLDVSMAILNDLLVQRDAWVKDKTVQASKGFEVIEPAAPASVLGAGVFRRTAIVGLGAGMAVPLLALVVFCWMDPRVRSGRRFERRSGLPVLVSLPKLESPFEKRLERSRFWTYLVLGWLFLGLYVYLVWLRMSGIL